MDTLRTPKKNKKAQLELAVAQPSAQETETLSEQVLVVEMQGVVSKPTAGRGTANNNRIVFFEIPA